MIDSHTDNATDGTTDGVTCSTPDAVAKPKTQPGQRTPFSKNGAETILWQDGVTGQIVQYLIGLSEGSEVSRKTINKDLNFDRKFIQTSGRVYRRLVRNKVLQKCSGAPIRFKLMPGAKAALQLNFAQQVNQTILVAKAKPNRPQRPAPAGPQQSTLPKVDESSAAIDYIALRLQQIGEEIASLSRYCAGLSQVTGTNLEQISTADLCAELARRMP